MKIFINGRFLAQPITGVQRYGRELLFAFDTSLEQGTFGSSVSVEVLTPRGMAIDLGVRRVRLRQVGWLSGHVWEQIVLPWAARGGVLFCPSNTAPIASLLTGQPVVVTVHSLSFLLQPASYKMTFRLVYRLLVALICRFARAVVTPSESERQALANRFPYVLGRLYRVPNGAVPRAFIEARKRVQQNSPAVHDPFVLFVGSLVEGKNLQTLLDAMAVVNHQTRLALRVVGSCGKGLRPAKYSIAPTIQQLVSFDGQVTVERLIQLYRDAACLVFPSYYEASPLPPLEAMALGCPVIASSIPALVERCGDAALYCDPSNAVDIARHILQLIGDANLRSALQEKGFERVNTFSWQGTATETLSIILNAAGNHGNTVTRAEDSPGSA